MLDLVVRSRETRVIRVGNGDVVPVRGCRGAGARVDVLDVLVAVGQVGVEAARARAPGLGRVDCEHRALALAGVRQHQVLDRAAGAAVGGRAVAWPAVGRRAGLHQADVLPEHLVLDARDDDVRRHLDVPGQRVLDAQVPAVLRRDLEARIDGVHRTVVLQARVEGQHLGRQVEAVDRVHSVRVQRERRERGVHRGRHVGLHDHDAVVREAVRDPDVRRAATEQAPAAVDRGLWPPLPVEADARHDQVAAIQRLEVAEAVARLEVGVERRRVAARELVHAHAGLDLEVRRDLPLVLDVEAVDVVAEGRRAVVRVVGERVRVVEVGRNAVLEVGDAAENVLALAARHEDIEDVEHLALVAHRHGVVAEEEVALQLDGVEVVGQRIRVAELVRTDEHRAAGRRADLHLRELGALQRVLARVHFLARRLELGREPLVPVREQLQRGGLHQDRAVVPVRRRRNAVLRGAVVRGDDLVALGALPGERRAVLVRDVPVELGEDLLVLLGQRVGAGTDVEAVDRLRDVHDLVVLGLRDARNRDREVRAGRAEFLRRDLVELLVAAEEEQLVLDDRPAEGAAVGLLLEGEGQVAVLAAVADQAVVTLVVERRAAELVGAGLGHDVDGRAAERRVLDRERRGQDRDRLDRVHR